jgi:hypothetical protein
MPSFIDLTRTAVRILADSVEKTREAQHPQVKGVTRILRAFERGDPDADLFDASDRFNRIDRSVRAEIAERSVEEAQAHVARRRGGKTGGGPAAREEAKPGLLGVLNRR